MDQTTVNNQTSPSKTRKSRKEFKIDDLWVNITHLYKLKKPLG